jgi:DNA-binding LytR/AlgR family response regulator
MTKIAYLEGSGNYTTVHLQNSEPLLLSKNIGLLGEILPTNNFVRLNKTYVISLAYLTDWEYFNAKSLTVRLPNGQWTEVARRRVAEVRDKLNNRN